MDLTRLKDQFFGLLNKIREALLNLGFAGAVGKFSAGLQQLSPERKRLLLIGLGGSLIVLILIISLSRNSGRAGSTSPHIASPLIPSEELFYPNEPDFAPQFLIEREPRHFWSLDDIRPYWRIPENPEFWRGEIKPVIDMLMEGVP